MKANREFIAGIVFILLAVLLVWLAGGTIGLTRIVIAILVASIALYLLNKISLIARTGAMILNPDSLVKFLMPRKYRNAIQELEKTEKKK